MASYKYKVKLVPGTLKKGKAVRQVRRGKKGAGGWRVWGFVMKATP